MPEPLDLNDPANSDIIDYLKSQGTGGTPTATAAPSGGQTSASGITAQTLPYMLSLLGPAAKGIGAAGAKTLGMMIGPAAKSWRMPTQFTAKEMEMKGHSPEQIFDATKLFKDVEGNWKTEIPDTGMKVKPLPEKKRSVMGNIQSFVEYPELFENYPDLANMKVAVDPSYGSELHGQIDPKINKITIGGKILGSGLTTAQRGVLLHELMHGGQSIEGWQGGANPDVLSPHLGQRLADAYSKTKDPELYRQLLSYGKNPKDVAHEAYWRVPGEAEARNVQDRYRYGLLGKPFHWPQTEDPESVKKALFAKGYDMRLNIPEDLPNDLRMLYDRQPALRSEKTGTPITMIGDRKYPWKTEDIPRRLQFDYTK